MSEVKPPRPVPHVNHTPELEAAAVGVLNAVDGAGKPVRLVSNPLDVEKVKAAMGEVSAWFVDPSFFFEGVPNGQLAAVTNLILLATLLREHLRAGNL